MRIPRFPSLLLALGVASLAYAQPHVTIPDDIYTTSPQLKKWEKIISQLKIRPELVAVNISEPLQCNRIAVENEGWGTAPVSETRFEVCHYDLYGLLLCEELYTWKTPPIPPRSGVYLLLDPWLNSVQYSAFVLIVTVDVGNSVPEVYESNNQTRFSCKLLK